MLKLIKKLLREELLKEKLTDVNSDVDFLYDKYFKSGVDEIAETGIVKRSVFEKGNTNTMTLSSDASNKANETNACLIQVNYGNKNKNGNFYNPSVSMISISVNDDAVRHSLEYGGDINKAKRVLSPLMQKSFAKEFTEEKIKGSIHHELVHWVDDTMNNRHIAKIVKNKPEDFNSHYIEIQAQIHNVVQLKRKHADIWDLMSFDEMLNMSPILISVYKDLKPENKKKWLIKLKRRMYREGLLGDEMR